MIDYKKRLYAFSNDFLRKLSQDKNDAVFFKPGGIRADCIITVVDVIGIDRFLNDRTCEKMVEYIQKYYENIFDLVYQYGGFINNAIGAQCEVISYNNDVNCIQKSIELLFKIKNKIESYLIESESNGCSFISSINYGEIAFLNLGAKERMISSVIGYNYQFALRLNKLCRQYHVKVLSTTDIHSHINGYLFRNLDTVKYEGDNIAYTLTEPIRDSNEGCTREIIIEFNEGIEKMKKKKWKEAIEKFENVIRMKEEDMPAKIMINRCNSLLKNPPGDNWDGIFHIREV